MSIRSNSNLNIIFVCSDMAQVEVVPISTKEIPPIPLTWISTDVPSPPSDLPIAVTATVKEDSLCVHGTATVYHTLGECLEGEPEVEHSPFEVVLHKDDIAGVLVEFFPETSEYDRGFVREPQLSNVKIFHRDPFGVVVNFASVFGSDKSYWIKALVKLLREKLSVQIQVIKDEKGPCSGSAGNGESVPHLR